MKVCVLLLTHQSKPTIFEHFDSIELPPGWSKYLLVDENSCAVSEFGDRSVVGFCHESLVKVGYHPISGTLIPGSAHFPVIEFAYTRKVDFVWAIEFDVQWTASWLDFFNEFDDYADFLATRVRRYETDANWCWWDSLKPPPGATIEWNHPNASLASFNPIYRLSAAAVCALRKRFLLGWSGHCEVTIPTLLEQDGLVVADMGGVSGFTPNAQRDRIYTFETMQWRPEFSLQDVPTFEPNLLYHPVKH